MHVHGCALSSARYKTCTSNIHVLACTSIVHVGVCKSNLHVVHKSNQHVTTYGTCSSNVHAHVMYINNGTHLLFCVANELSHYSGSSGRGL